MLIVWQLWREAARFPVAVALSVVLLVLVLAAHLGQAVAIAWSMAAVLSGRTGDVVVALLSIAGIAVVRLLLSLAQTAAATRLGGQVRGSLRGRALRASLVPGRLHDTAARDGAVRASLGDGIDGTDAYVSKYLPAIGQLVIVIPVVVTFIALLSPFAAAGVAGGVLVAILGPMAWRRMMARRGLDHWDSYEALSADLLESLRGMATLRALGAVPGTRRRLDARSEALRRATERVMRASLAETAVTDFAVQAGVVAAVIAAIADAVTGRAPALEVYLVLLLASEAFRPVRDLSRHWHSGFLGLTAIPGLTAIGAFDATPSKVVAAQPGAARAETLHVSDLTFRYPGSPAAVLTGLDLTARRGSLSAIVGPSGSGKSTLFDLLLGFLTPETGRIELDGRSLRTADVAVVSQRPVLFTGTIRDNLLVGGRGTDDDSLVAACRDAGILDEIRALPRGFDAEVTEAGTSLSGGQRQRLALARALLARRPVLLVDEPTSALDAARAAGVIETLHAAAQERIVIMISHRPESLVGVPSVLRLRDGRLERSTP